MSDFQNSVEVATIQKNSLDELRVSVDTFKNHQFIQIRTWTEKSDSKEKIPLRKGITFGFHVLPEIITALQKIEHSAKQKDMLKS